MKLTKEMFEAGRSDAGGFNQKQLRAIGLADMPERGWPKSGWPARLIGSEVTDAQYQEFLALRKKSKVVEPEENIFARIPEMAAEIRGDQKDSRFTIEVTKDTGDECWLAICKHFGVSGIGPSPSKAIENCAFCIESTLLTREMSNGKAAESPEDFANTLFTSNGGNLS